MYFELNHESLYGQSWRAVSRTIARSCRRARASFLVRESGNKMVVSIRDQDNRRQRGRAIGELPHLARALRSCLVASGRADVSVSVGA